MAAKMPQIYIVGFLLLAVGVVAAILLLLSRQRCPRCDASLPRTARQCPHCGQVLGLAAGPEFSGQPRYCPECRSEFRPGMVSCPHCEVPLQNQLPPEEPAEDQANSRGALKTLCPALTPEEADFLISILAEQNIRAVLIEAKPNSGHNHAPLITVGVGEIMVWEKDLARAKEILAAVEADSEIIAEGPEDGDGWVCDECGASVGPTDSACPRCGAEFEEDE